MDKKKLLQYVVIFLLSYLIVSVFFNPGKDQATPKSEAPFDLVTSNKQYGQDDLVSATLYNNTEFSAYVTNDCPSEPLTVLNRQKGEWQPISIEADISCGTDDQITVEPGQAVTISYHSWNHDLFGEIGIYKLAADIKVPDSTSLEKTLESNEFEVTPRGFFSWLWMSAFYQPIYNILIYLVSILPGHDLGWAIILLTLLMRTVLLIPSHRALKSQRKMQELQPKLNHIKEKYKGDQQRITQETMLLWKEYKINPLSSCLPLLIQLPLLIALFYVIQEGLNPNNAYLLYGDLKEFSLQAVNTNFLGILELTEKNLVVLPLIVGGLQFLQMQLGIIRTNKQKIQQKDEMQKAQQMMVYIMPVMITIFTASVPAGVGLYWSVSTLYGIVQQLIVNREKPDTHKKDKKKDEVEVRVVTKHSKKTS